MYSSILPSIHSNTLLIWLKPTLAGDADDAGDAGDAGDADGLGCAIDEINEMNESIYCGYIIAGELGRRRRRGRWCGRGGGGGRERLPFTIK